MFIIIDLRSNNIQSLKNFQSFLMKNITNEKLKIFFNFHSKTAKLKTFTILKSPHVNKIAQEQFNYRSYRIKIVLFSFNFLLTLYYLKLIKNNLFINVDIRIRLCSKTIPYHKKLKYCFNPNKFIIEFNHPQIVKSYLTLFELFGHFHFQTKTLRSLNSSVGRAKD